MTQNTNNSPAATVADQTPAPAAQPAIVQPAKGDAAKVVTAEKK